MLVTKQESVLEVKLNNKDFAILAEKNGRVCAPLAANRTVGIIRTNFSMGSPKPYLTEGGDIEVEFPIDYKNPSSLGKETYRIVDRSMRPTEESIRFFYSPEST